MRRKNDFILIKVQRNNVNMICCCFMRGILWMCVCERWLSMPLICYVLSLIAFLVVLHNKAYFLLFSFWFVCCLLQFSIMFWQLHQLHIINMNARFGFNFSLFLERFLHIYIFQFFIIVFIKICDHFFPPENAAKNWWSIIYFVRIRV